MSTKRPPRSPGTVGRDRRASGTHLITAFAATVIFVTLVNALGGSDASADLRNQTVRLGIEHKEPLTVDFRFGVKNNAPIGLIELTHDGKETVLVGLPETWERREVRGRSLEDTPADPPSFGFIQWHVPEGAILSFRAPGIPHTLDIQNPSSVPLKIRVVKVDLTTGAVERNVMLVTDQEVNIW